MISWKRRNLNVFIGLMVLICGLAAGLLARDPIASTNQAQFDRDRKAVEAVGAPDQMIADSFDNAKSPEIEARLSVLKAGRLAAFRGIVKMMDGDRAGGGMNFEFRDSVNMRAELSRAEIEYDNSPQTRLAVYKAVLESAVQLEQSVKVSYDLGAHNGTHLSLMRAIAGRLKAEEQLIREILAQRKLMAK